MTPNIRPPSDGIINALLGISLVLIILLFFMLFGISCASAPLKVGVPHTIRTNEFLATYEIRLRGTEESVIVGRHGLAGASRRQRIDSGDNLGNRGGDGAFGLHNWESLK